MSPKQTVLTPQQKMMMSLVMMTTWVTDTYMAARTMVEGCMMISHTDMCIMECILIFHMVIWIMIMVQASMMIGHTVVRPMEETVMMIRLMHIRVCTTSTVTIIMTMVKWCLVNTMQVATLTVIAMGMVLTDIQGRVCLDTEEIVAAMMIRFTRLMITNLVTTKRKKSMVTALKNTFYTVTLNIAGAAVIDLDLISRFPISTESVCIYLVLLHMMWRLSHPVI
mmetsp:Transcript_21540/g.21673  ORF Transcript_21540/g.21673 Transcript_21540/m.21673 type:complete len:223 (+) Transcript_21540:548-1216(+)